ncbi:MAG TPA: polyprenyl synthetase family protein [Candidatus Sulfomarinibacteraceae bacterium]|nr:polyprenyl synthetase family protein [Candidatus Sulfomarinibacteraceae bacterium]
MPAKVHHRQPEPAAPRTLGDRGHRDPAPALRGRIEARLAELVPPEGAHPDLLHRAMRYSLLAGGKRIRPLLTIQVATDFGASEIDALDPACAIEMVHTASLILDDMPCMDDATLRRGEPANHRVFGEDTAILAATALLNRAFGVVADGERLPAATRLDLVRLLSEAVGSNGIIAGQLCDLRMRHGQGDDIADITQMYHQKTGALFVAALEAGARVAGVEEAWVRAVREYAVNLGLAFQILDDLLDAYGSQAEIGKDTGQDETKNTLVSRLGPDGARLAVCRYVRSAATALEPLGESGTPLIDLARSYTEPTMERVLYL